MAKTSPFRRFKKSKKTNFVALAVLIVGLAAGVFLANSRESRDLRSAAASVCSGQWKCVKGTSSSPNYECNRFNGMTEASCTGGGNGQGNYCGTEWTREGGCAWSGGIAPTPTSRPTPAAPSATPKSSPTPIPTGKPKTCDNGVKKGDTACNHNGDTVQYRCINPEPVGDHEQWKSEDCSQADRCHGRACTNPCSGKKEDEACDFAGDGETYDDGLLGNSCNKDSLGYLLCFKNTSAPCDGKKVGDLCVNSGLLGGWGNCLKGSKGLYCDFPGEPPSCMSNKVICLETYMGACKRDKKCLLWTKCAGPPGKAKCL